MTYEPQQITPMDYNKPWFEMKDDDWYCNLCSAWATDGHIGSTKHHKRALNPEWYGYGGQGHDGVDSVVESPDFNQPWIVRKDGGYYCQLCNAWATDGHIGSDKHRKRSAEPSWYWSDESASAPSGAVTGMLPYTGPAHDPPLPTPWERHWSEQYKTHYYYNPKTLTSQWDKPELVLPSRTQVAPDHAVLRGVGAPPPQRQTAPSTINPVLQGSASSAAAPSAISSQYQLLPQPAPALPPSWEEFHSQEHGQPYYHNRETGETRWEFPEWPSNTSLNAAFIEC